MNSLILATTPLWPSHHAESIEIAHRLKNTGKHLYVCCTGALHSCPANSGKSSSLCNKCRCESNYTRKVLLPRNFEFIELGLSETKHDLHHRPSNTAELLDIYHEEMPIGRLVASQLFNDSKGEYIDVEKNCEKIQNLLLDGVALYEEIKKLILKYDISQVYAWNGRRQSDGPALWAAKALNKRYVAYIAGGQRDRIYMLDSLSVQDFEARATDLNLLIDSNEDLNLDFLQQQANIYFQEYMTGSLKQTGFVYEKKINSEKPKAKNLEKPLLLIVTSSPKEHVHQSTYEKYFGDDPYGHTLAFLDDHRIFDKFDVVVRWHPFNRRSNELTRRRISQLIERHHQAEHYPPGSNVDTYELMSRASVVYGTGSTVAQYAALSKKIVLIYGPSAIMFGESVISVQSPGEVVEWLLNVDTFDFEANGRNINGICRLAYYARMFGNKFQHIDSDDWVLKASNLTIRRPRPFGDLWRELRRKVSYFTRNLGSVLK